MFDEQRRSGPGFVFSAALRGPGEKANLSNIPPAFCTPKRSAVSVGLSVSRETRLGVSPLRRPHGQRGKGRSGMVSFKSDTSWISVKSSESGPQNGAVNLADALKENTKPCDVKEQHDNPANHSKESRSCDVLSEALTSESVSVLVANDSFSEITFSKLKEQENSPNVTRRRRAKHIISDALKEESEMPENSDNMHATLPPGGPVSPPGGPTAPPEHIVDDEHPKKFGKIEETHTELTAQSDKLEEDQDSKSDLTKSAFTSFQKMENQKDENEESMSDILLCRTPTKILKDKNMKLALCRSSGRKQVKFSDMDMSCGGIALDTVATPSQIVKKFECLNDGNSEVDRELYDGMSKISKSFLTSDRPRSIRTPDRPRSTLTSGRPRSIMKSNEKSHDGGPGRRRGKRKSIDAFGPSVAEVLTDNQIPHVVMEMNETMEPPAKKKFKSTLKIDVCQIYTPSPPRYNAKMKNSTGKQTDQICSTDRQMDETSTTDIQMVETSTTDRQIDETSSLDRKIGQPSSTDIQVEETGSTDRKMDQTNKSDDMDAISETG